MTRDDIYKAIELPEDPQQVTAELLARYASVIATDATGRTPVLLREISRTTDRETRDVRHEAFAHLVGMRDAVWALAYVLREIPTADADRLARSIVAAWRDEASMHELPPEWMAEYGLEPEDIFAFHLGPAGVQPKPTEGGIDNHA